MNQHISHLNWFICNDSFNIIIFIQFVLDIDTCIAHLLSYTLRIHSTMFNNMILDFKMFS